MDDEKFRWIDELEEKLTEDDKMPDDMRDRILSKVSEKISNHQNEKKKVIKSTTLKRVAIILITIGSIGGIYTITYASIMGHLPGILNLSLSDTLDNKDESISEPEALPTLIQWVDKQIDSKIVTEQSFTDLFFFSAVGDCTLQEAKSNMFSSPGFIFDSYNMAIFTKEDSQGWNLKRGESLVLTFHIDPQFATATDDGELIQFGYVYDGQYFDLSNDKNIKFSFTLIADNDGIYYPTIENYSLSYLKVLDIKIK